MSASTQNQASSALLFLYAVVLNRPLDGLTHVVRAKRPVRLPVVLTRDEVSRVMARMSGVCALMAGLTYGSGLRLLECCTLRVKDLDFERLEILVRDGKAARSADRAAAGVGGSVDRSGISERSRRSTTRMSRLGQGACGCPTRLG